MLRSFYPSKLCSCSFALKSSFGMFLPAVQDCARSWVPSSGEICMISVFTWPFYSHSHFCTALSPRSSRASRTTLRFVTFFSELMPCSRQAYVCASFLLASIQSHSFERRQVSLADELSWVAVLAHSLPPDSDNKDALEHVRALLVMLETNFSTI